MKRIILLLCVLLPAVVRAQMAALYPPENGITDPSLTLFVDSLKTAIEKKDTAFIFRHLSENIKNSFGGDGGIEEFKASWNLDSANTKFWPLVDKIVAMGGSYAYEKEIYAFPYVFTEWPDAYDPFAHAAITGSRVNVRDQPGLDSSTVLGQFTYDIVLVDYNRSYPPFTEPKTENVNYIGPKEWYYVESLDGALKGFVHWQYVWSPIDYRLGLKQEEGRWTITYLIAGD